MDVLDFQDRTMPLPPPSNTQLRRLAPDLNKVTSYARLLLLSDRTTPFLATTPIWKDDESLRRLRLVDKYLMPELERRLKETAQNTGRDAEAAAGSEKISAGDTCGGVPSGQWQRWMRSVKLTITPVAIAALAGFVGGYNSHARNHRANIAVLRSPEIRRVIPVEPEVRKAIPVQTREPQSDRRSESRGRSPLRQGTRFPLHIRSSRKLDHKGEFKEW